MVSGRRRIERGGHQDDLYIKGWICYPGENSSGLEVAVDDTLSAARCVGAGSGLSGINSTDCSTGAAVVRVILQVFANATAHRGASLAGDAAGSVAMSKAERRGWANVATGSAVEHISGEIYTTGKAINATFAQIVAQVARIAAQSVRAHTVGVRYSSRADVIATATVG